MTGGVEFKVIFGSRYDILILKMSHNRKRTLPGDSGVQEYDATHSKQSTKESDLENKMTENSTSIGGSSTSCSKYFKINSKSCDNSTSEDKGSTSNTMSGNEDEEAKESLCVGKKLGRSFFEKSCGDLAKSLLGAILVRRLKDGQFLRGKIVETESYPGGEDTASHSYRGKRTTRNEAMFMDPGTAYVYSIHSYVCLNISSLGDGAAVLLRGLEPLYGHDTMRKLRGRRRADAGVNLKDKEVTNGPSKFTEAFDITKEEVNKLDLTDNDVLWIEEGNKIAESEIVSCARININCDQEWKEAKFRFYVKGNKYVSVKNKVAEQLMEK